MGNSMPLSLGRIRADAEIAHQGDVVPRRAARQLRLPESDSPVVSLIDLDLLQAVLDGLYRLDAGAAR